MTLARTGLFLAIAAPHLFGAASALAQRTDDQGYEIEDGRAGAATGTAQGSDSYTVTTRRNYNGGYTTKDSDGYSVTTRREYHGGYTIKDSDGYKVTCRPVHYNGGTRCRRTAPAAPK